MAYSNFTLAAVLTTFGLETVESAGTFSEIAPVDPSDHLTTALSRNVPLEVLNLASSVGAVLLQWHLLANGWRSVDLPHKIAKI